MAQPVLWVLSDDAFCNYLYESSILVILESLPQHGEGSLRPKDYER